MRQLFKKTHTNISYVTQSKSQIIILYLHLKSPCNSDSLFKFFLTKTKTHGTYNA